MPQLFKAGGSYILNGNILGMGRISGKSRYFRRVAHKQHPRPQTNLNPHCVIFIFIFFSNKDESASGLLERIKAVFEISSGKNIS